MLKEYIERFKWWANDTINPRNGYCKFAKFYKVLSYVYQTCTFWEAPSRELLYRLNENFGKLLDDGLYFIEMRSRGPKTVYYKATNYFGHVKVYKMEYKEKGKNVNVFGRVVMALIKDETDLDQIVTIKKCIYSKWCLTKNQCITALKDIRKLTKDLDWDVGLCTEQRSYAWAKHALDYLNGKKTYWMDTLGNTEENERGLKHEMYLITRDIVNRDKYAYPLQDLMYTVLNPVSDERNKNLKDLLKKLLKAFEKEGYTSFRCLYRKIYY